MDSAKTKQYVDRAFDEEIIPQLVEYIRIPCISPAFDAAWEKNGYMQQAVALVEKWCRAQPIAGMKLEVIKEDGRTPLIFIDIPAYKCSSDASVLLYGHLDKQPEMVGWDDDLGPWKPVIKEDRLYGRGGADDGYAVYSALNAISALQAQEVPHARCVVLVEASEESGSPDLPYYIEMLTERIGRATLVVCLDSGCGDYEHLWCTTSLRGMVMGNLTVEILSEGVHSGDAGGVAASTFRVMRQLLSRVEDETTGNIRLSSCQADIPDQRRQQSDAVARILGTSIYDKYPFHQGARPLTTDLTELLLNRTWRAALAVTGVSGMPPLENAGNVMRPLTAVRLSMRLPPSCDSKKAFEEVKQALVTEPPYGAKVSFEGEWAEGWNAPAFPDWLLSALEASSKTHFGAEALFMGEGGSIPFMALLGEKFPEAQFMIVGVLGPESNAHGPNEFLHIPVTKKVTCCVADVLAAHAR